MPMFDNPKKELQRLQEQLLSEEEDTLDDLVDEYGEDEIDVLFEDDYEDEYQQEHYRRNYNSGNRRNTIFDEIEDAFDDPDEEEPFALFVEEKRGLLGRKKRVPVQNKKQNRGLKILLLLEIIAVLCVLIWWVVMKL